MRGCFFLSMIAQGYALLMNQAVLRQLYGEWLILHSNHPCFSGMNNKFVTLFPKREIILRSYENKGPFVIQNEKSGSFRIDCFQEGCSFEEGDDVLCKIEIRWKQKMQRYETFLGISLKEFPMAVVYSDMSSTTELNLNLLEKNQLYLSDPQSHINLIRNSRPYEPESGTRLPVFIASQVFGSILLHILHFSFKDLF